MTGDDASARNSRYETWSEWALAEIDRLRTVLHQIRDEAGKVCEHYETCEHESCASSYAAWAIADAALAGQEYPAGANP